MSYTCIHTNSRDRLWDTHSSYPSRATHHVDNTKACIGGARDKNVIQTTRKSGCDIGSFRLMAGITRTAFGAPISLGVRGDQLQGVFKTDCAQAPQATICDSRKERNKKIMTRWRACIHTERHSNPWTNTNKSIPLSITSCSCGATGSADDDASNSDNKPGTTSSFSSSG